MIWGQRLMCIAWPAFLAAAVLEMLVFALIDPNDLHWLGRELDWSAMGVYAASFFAFWVVAMASSALTLLLAAAPQEINRQPAEP